MKFPVPPAGLSLFKRFTIGVLLGSNRASGTSGPERFCAGAGAILAGDTAGPIRHPPLNLSRRRFCNPLGRRLGCAAHCCAISVALARASLTAAFPRPIRSSARRTAVGTAKSCSLVIFMIRPPTARTPSDDSDNAPRSRPSHGRIRRGFRGTWGLPLSQGSAPYALGGRTFNHISNRKVPGTKGVP